MTCLFDLSVEHRYKSQKCKTEKNVRKKKRMLELYYERIFKTEWAILFDSISLKENDGILAWALITKYHRPA